MKKKENNFLGKMKEIVNKISFNQEDRSYNHKRIVRPKCRFCGKDTRALNNNGIIGPGYCEWNYVCKSCGKVQ